jgi:micrococcal nuclease
MRSVLAAPLLLLLAAPAPVRASAAPAFADGPAVEVARIIDGETLALTDERVLRLVDIDVPARGALAAQAKVTLGALLEGQPLAAKFAGNREDRQGRMLAQLYAGDRWVQGELLRRGLWAEPGYAIVPAAEAGRRAGSFALVAGTVANVVSNAGGVLLVFGADRHNGLVLTIAPDVVRLCRVAGLDPAALQGKSLLTRGYVDGTRRPTIAISFPEQIELQKNAIARHKKAAPKSFSGPR